MGYRVSIIGRRGSDGSGLLSKQFFFFHLNLSSTLVLWVKKCHRRNLTTKYGFLIAGFFFLKAAFGAASKQSGHQEHREEYCFFPYTLQLGKEPQPIHPLPSNI